MEPSFPASRALLRLGLRHRAWRYRLSVDPDEIRWMRVVLRPGDTVVDIGAYKGGYTYWMRRWVGVGGSVIAFEPQPELAAYLERCVGAFSWSNVRIEQTALSSSPGRRELRVPGPEPSPGASLTGASLPPDARAYTVRVETLDARLAALGTPPPVRLLKCDVEGHELDVFEGAGATLARDRPLLLFECEARHDPSRSVVDVFGRLQALGYRGFFFWRGRALDVERFSLSEHQVEGRRPYGNNVIFVPDEWREGRARPAPEGWASAPGPA